VYIPIRSYWGRREQVCSPSPGKYFSVDTTVQHQILDGTMFMDSTVVQDTVAEKELWAQADNEDNDGQSDSECWNKTKQMLPDLLVGTAGQRKFLPAVRWGNANAKATINALTPASTEVDSLKDLKGPLYFTGFQPRNSPEDQW